MKQAVGIILSILLFVLSCGCTQEAEQTVNSSNKQFDVSLETFQEQDIVVPATSAEQQPASLPLEALPKETEQIFIDDKIDEHFWGSKQTLGETGIESKEVLFQQSPYTETPLQYPNDLPSWKVGSGKYAILQNRYIYQWKGYSDEQGYDVLHDVKLTRTDVQTGEVSVIEERQLNTPLIYLCAIDDNCLLSYYITKAPSDKTDYATLAVAEIYNFDGSKTEIIQERYENHSNWSNSIGTLIERFTVSDGEIYGFGRRLIDGEYKFFLYHYTRSGELLETRQIFGIENIIREEQPLEFHLVNDYIIVRTYETLTTHICKQTEDELDYIAKATFGNLFYNVLRRDDNAYIIFMESTVNDDATIKDKECPLYIINTKTDKTVSFSIQTMLEKPYSTDMRLVADGDLVFSFCEGVYDPLLNKKFILTKEKLQQLLP